MEWRHAAEEHQGAIGIDIFIDPFGPCSKDSLVGDRPIDFFILDLSTFEWSTLPSTRKIRLKLTGFVGISTQLATNPVVLLTRLSF